MSQSWYEQDALWTSLEPVIGGRIARDRMAAQIPRFEELAALPTTGTVADLGSGSGRLAIPLAGCGHKVTAVDQCPALLSLLAKEAKAHKLPVEVVRRDLRAFERPEAFDAVFLWGDTFGYFEHASEDLQVLTHAARSLKSSGRLVLQLTPRELACKGFPKRTWNPLPGDKLLLEENALIRDWGAVHHTWVHLDGQKRTVFRGTRRLYSTQGVRRMLHKAGFAAVTCFGGIDGRAFAREAETLIVVASL